MVEVILLEVPSVVYNVATLPPYNGRTRTWFLSLVASMFIVSCRVAGECSRACVGCSIVRYWIELAPRVSYGALWLAIDEPNNKTRFHFTTRPPLANRLISIGARRMR